MTARISTSKPSAFDAQLNQFEDEDDGVSLPDLVKKANAAKGAKDGIQEVKAISTDLDGVTAVKKRRVINSLTPDALLKFDGLDNLKIRLEGISPKCAKSPGYELADLDRLLQVYQSWADNLGVREGSSWPDFVEKLDRLKKNEIRKYLSRLREGDVMTTAMPFRSVTASVPTTTSPQVGLSSSRVTNVMSQTPVAAYSTSPASAARPSSGGMTEEQ